MCGGDVVRVLAVERQDACSGGGVVAGLTASGHQSGLSASSRSPGGARAAVRESWNRNDVVATAFILSLVATVYV